MGSRKSKFADRFYKHFIPTGFSGLANRSRLSASEAGPVLYQRTCRVAYSLSAPLRVVCCLLSFSDKICAENLIALLSNRNRSWNDDCLVGRDNSSLFRFLR